MGNAESWKSITFYFTLYIGITNTRYIVTTDIWKSNWSCKALSEIARYRTLLITIYSPIGYVLQ
jgi:hypothetical protein